MKKLVLFFTVVFMSISSIFAYQQTITAGPSMNTNGMTVNINATCAYMRLECSWYASNANASGGAQAYDASSGRLIGEYHYEYNDPTRSYKSDTFYNQYWGSVQVYLNAMYCNGEATLKWGN